MTRAIIIFIRWQFVWFLIAISRAALKASNWVMPEFEHVEDPRREL